MPVSRNIYPKMVSVSKNCLLTSQLYQTIVEKLSESEIEDFCRWLQLVEDEKNNDKKIKR